VGISDFKIIAFPLKIKAEASIVRVIASIDDGLELVLP